MSVNFFFDMIQDIDQSQVTEEKLIVLTLNFKFQTYF